MHTFAIGPNYKNVQPNLVTVSDSETSFPAVDTAIMRAPEKVFVQALSTNTESIFIGKTGVLSDGTDAVYELPAGSSVFLPNHLLSSWKLICASGGQECLATYFQGVF